MNAQRALKRTSWIVVGLVLIVFIGLAFFHQRQTRAPDSGAVEIFSDLEKAAMNEAAVSNKDVADGNGETEALQYQLQAAEEELDMAQAELNEELDRKAELAQQRRKMAKTIREDPAMVSLMREAIVSRNQAFIEAFKIPPEDADTFADILLAEQLAGLALTDEASQIMSPTEAQRRSFQQRWEEYRAEYESKKTDLLGAAAVQEYPAYTSRYTMETRVDDFSGLFDSNEQLTAIQRERLVDALVDAQGKFAEETDGASDEAYLFPSDIYAESNVNRMIDRLSRRNELWLETARGILSASQTEQVEASLKNQFERSVSVMKMSALEYGYADSASDGSTDAGK